jgi:hypothetical protein
MNFWEARAAALKGKKVKRLIGEDEFSGAYTPLYFQTRPMEPYEINGHWEIVEEPRTVVQYVNLYLRPPGELSFGESHITRELALGVRYPDSIGMIEIVTNSGRLVSARNV